MSLEDLLVIPSRVYVGVVAIDEDIGMGVFERARQEISWPEDAVLRRPRLLGLAVQAVDEDDVHFGLRMSVHGGTLIARDLLVNGPLYPFKRTARVSNPLPPIKPHA